MDSSFPPFSGYSSQGKCSCALGVILARGGSQGIPGKNARLLAGTPLIVRAIERMRAANSISHVLVSTDDDQIAQLAQEAGAEVGFRRPAELASHCAPSLGALQHAVRWWIEQGGTGMEPSQLVVSHQATSPFCESADIDQALAVFLTGSAGYLKSVTEIKEPPQWMGKLVDGQFRHSVSADLRPTRRQDLPLLYRLNGALSIYRSDVLLSAMPEMGEPTAYVMPLERSLDLDDAHDWAIAEALLSAQQRQLAR